jgi:hypothetical protein
MGNMGETMKKLWIRIAIFLTCSLSLFADDQIEKLTRRVKIMAPHAVGWCSEEKCVTLLNLILETKPKTVVEIGVFGGSSFLPMACGIKHLKSGVIYAVDPWNNAECIKYLDPVEDKEHLDWWRTVRLLDVYASFLDKLLLFDCEDCTIILKKSSEEAASDIAFIDVLHIDGHRSEEITALDVKLYLPKVVSGGYICLGDTLSYYKQKAIEMLLKECQVVKVIDNGNCILFKKR